MRGIDTQVRKIRRAIFREVANMAYNSKNLAEDMEALQTVCDLQYPFRQILRNDPLDLHKAARTASHCSSVDCHNTLRCFPVDFRSRMASPANSDFPVFLYVSWLRIWCRMYCHPAFCCRTSDISYKIPPLHLK